MPDGRPALTGAERKRRHDRRARDGLLHARADLPPEIGEWLIDRGVKADDVVVLWPKKKAPVVCRRLARVVPYPGEADGPAPLSDRYYFADLETGAMFDVAINKTAAIHKVVGDL